MNSLKRGKSCCPIMLLLRLLIEAARVSSTRVAPEISFVPPLLHDLVEQGNASVTVGVRVPQDYLLEYGTNNRGKTEEELNWVLDLSPIHSQIASVEGSRRTFKPSELTFNNGSRFYYVEATFLVHGKFLGKTGIRARFVPASWIEHADAVDIQATEEIGHIDDPSTLDVWVKRNANAVWLTNMFVSTLIVLISLANVLMGCELDLNVVVSTVRRPVAPCIGFFTQFVVMPLLAYSIAQTVFVSRGLHSLALGLFVTGCSPGGGASNFWTVLLDGNVNLSVTMTFLSTVASLVMMPLWMTMLGGEFLQGFSSDFRMRVPYRKIVSSLVTLVVPLLIGVAIARWRPNWAAHSRRLMRPFIAFVLVFVIVFGCVANSYMWRIMTGPALIGGLLLPWCGFMCGCFTSIATGRTPADVTAIAIETGIQNTGIAILMLKWSFPEPDADISALVPVIVACFTPGPLLLGAAVHLTMKYFKKRESKTALEEVAFEEAKVKCFMGALALTEVPMIESSAEVEKFLDQDRFVDEV